MLPDDDAEVREKDGYAPDVGGEDALMGHADGGVLVLKDLHPPEDRAVECREAAGRPEPRPALNPADVSEAAPRTGVARGTGRSVRLGFRVVRSASRARAVSHVTGSSPTRAELLEPPFQGTGLALGFGCHCRHPLEGWIRRPYARLKRFASRVGGTGVRMTMRMTLALRLTGLTADRRRRFESGGRLRQSPGSAAWVGG